MLDSEEPWRLDLLDLIMYVASALIKETNYDQCGYIKKW